MTKNTNTSLGTPSRRIGGLENGLRSEAHEHIPSRRIGGLEIDIRASLC